MAHPIIKKLFLCAMILCVLNPMNKRGKNLTVRWGHQLTMMPDWKTVDQTQFNRTWRRLALNLS